MTVTGHGRLAIMKLMRRESSVGDLGYAPAVGRGVLMPFIFVSALAIWRDERYALMKVVYFALFSVVSVYNSYSGVKTPGVVCFVLGFGLFFQRRLIRPEGPLSRDAAGSGGGRPRSRSC